MGNVLLDEHRKGDPAEFYQRWLQQNPDLLRMEILAENKLFKSCSYKLNGRYVVLKAFFKRDLAPITDYFKVSAYPTQIFDTLNRMTEKEKSVHIMPVKLISRTTSQSFVVAYRQKMFQTLEEDISSKQSKIDLKKRILPFKIEWLIYQMINAVHTVHRNFNFYHGHIRTSNFLETTYGFLTLTDFANYKPLYMFEDSEEGLPEFRLFYSSSIHNCTLAPEKITESSEFTNFSKTLERNPSKLFSSINHEEWISTNASYMDQNLSASSQPQNREKQSSPKNRHVSLSSTFDKINVIGSVNKMQEMDIFSLGCSILEVLRDGKPLLTYEKLIKFKKGEYSLQGFIEQGCKNLKGLPQGDRESLIKLLTKMLSLSP